MHSNDQSRTHAIAYSPSQVAQLLNVGRTTVFALIRDGKLRARKLGARTLVAHADVLRLLDELASVEARDAPTK